MPRFEEYPELPAGQQVPNGAIFLFADPTDLDADGDPRTKRIPAERLPGYGVVPVVTTVVPNSFGATILPAGMKSGDVISFNGPASASVPFFGFNGTPPPEGAIIIVRNEKPNTAVTIVHDPATGTWLLEGNNVVLEGNRNAFVSFYVRRNGNNWSLRQIGGGYY